MRHLSTCPFSRRCQLSVLQKAFGLLKPRVPIVTQYLPHRALSVNDGARGRGPRGHGCWDPIPVPPVSH